MKRVAIALIIASLAATSAAARQTAAPTSAAPPQSGAPEKPLTVDSKVRDLVANPKTDAVLRAVIPTVRADEQFTSLGADLPLRDIAQYAPELTDAKLKELAVELAKAQAAR